MPRRQWIRAAACAAAVVGALATPIGVSAVAVAAPNPHGVLVGRNRVVIDVFHDAKCSISKRNGFLAVSKPRHSDAALYVHVQPFDGFHRYALEAGKEDGPILRSFVSFTDPGGVDFASNFIPPYRVASGGAVDFSDRGGLVGVGFEPMFNAAGSDQVLVTGVMVCHYPKKRGKR